MSQSDQPKTHQGGLCKRGHDDGTGHSIRFKSGACVACEVERKGRPKRSAPLYSEPEAALPRGRAGGDDSRQVKVNRSHSHRRWYERNRERLNEKKRAARAAAKQTADEECEDAG